MGTHVESLVAATLFARACSSATTTKLVEMDASGDGGTGGSTAADDPRGVRDDIVGFRRGVG